MSIEPLAKNEVIARLGTKVDIWVAEFFDQQAECVRLGQRRDLVAELDWASIDTIAIQFGNAPVPLQEFFRRRHSPLPCGRWLHAGFLD